MAFKISYNTLPDAYSTDPSSVGYYVSSSVFIPINNTGWQKVELLQSVPLSQGIYNISANISFKDSPNSFAYIILSDNSNGSIWNTTTNGSNIPQNMSKFNTYQGYTTSPEGAYSLWFPVAGQQMRMTSSTSCALSLSRVIKISNNNTRVACIFNIQGAGTQDEGAAFATITSVRIA